jgi:hypothetical protein
MKAGTGVKLQRFVLQFHPRDFFTVAVIASGESGRACA